MRDLYLPVEVVEAIGRASIARAQCELSLDILVAILADSTSPGECQTADAFKTKAEYLGSAKPSALLQHDCGPEMKRIADAAGELDRRYSAAAMGSIYSRGAGQLEELLRPLAQRAGVAPRLVGLTADRILRLADEFRTLSRDAAALATSMFKSGERLPLPDPNNVTVAMTGADQQVAGLEPEIE